MSIKSDYEQYQKRQEELREKPTGKFWINQEGRYVKPFQIYGNLYYVGDSWVCVHLIDTGEGLLLLDAGNCGAEAMLIQAVWEAGFRPDDVRWIILSHGHVDHFGAAGFFQRMFGTRVYLGEPDARMFRERPWLSMIQESGNVTDCLCRIDGEIHDGEEMTFGATAMKFYLVPGHTEGCIACFFDVTDGRERKRAGYYGGFGFNTLTREFLEEFGDPGLFMRRTYLESLEKVRGEKVELFVGNHTANVSLLEKRAYMETHPGENPFLDSDAWGVYLDGKREEILTLMREDA